MFRKIFLLVIMLCLLFVASACEKRNDYEEDALSASNPFIDGEDSNADAVDTNHVHSYSEPTCTTPMTCSCGMTAGVALGHSFSIPTCTTPAICQRCGYASDEDYGHEYTEATCVLSKKCRVCGETSGSALGHEYKNDTCVRCGEVDPDTLPVGLHELVIIDHTDIKYSYKNESMTDTFGNTYSGYHFYFTSDSARSIHYLKGEYSTLSFDIVAEDDSWSGSKATVEIYVDDVLVYSKNNISRTTSKIHVDLDVTNGQQLKIRVKETASGYNIAHIALVNAELTKTPK